MRAELWHGTAGSDTLGREVSLRYSIVIACALLAGCNLFSSTPTNDMAAPDAGADVGESDSDNGDSSFPSDMPSQDLGTRDLTSDMPANPDRWALVTAGFAHTCALTTDGRAYCWGAGDEGKLGTGTTSLTTRPLAVVNAPSLVDLQAGGDHTCGLDTEGALWCWGLGGHFGAPDSQSTPFLVAAGPFTNLSVGDDAVCVIDAEGLAKCVGENDWGQLGLPTGGDVAVLTDPGGAPFPAADVAVGNEFTCVLGADGAVTCFGRDLATEVDDEDAAAFLTQPITTPTPLVSLDAGEDHACGYAADGSIHCWGAHPFIGTLTTGGGPTTAGVLPLLVDLTSFDGGAGVVCGLDADGIGYCLGSNYRGIQGKGTDNPDAGAAEPIERIATSDALRTISVGYRHACAITAADELVCWGEADDGRLGNGEVGWRSEPYEIDSTIAFAIAAVGEYHSCGLDVTGTLHCWGRGAYGALGSGSYDHAYEPTAVVGLTFAEVDAWGSHTCGLQADGTAYCWGTDSRGVLGNGSTGGGNSPDLVQAPEALTALSTNVDHACAIGVTDVFCWGDELDVGANVNGNRNTPYALPSANHPVYAQLSAGTQHSCGVDVDGNAHCFGTNNVGQLGNGTTTTSRNSSVAVSGGHVFRFVRAGNQVSCGITTGDALLCWGAGARVADGTTSNRNTPTAESAGLSWSDVNMGDDSVCGLTTDGSVYCWGDGSAGRLGVRDTSARQSPTLVALPETAVHVAAGGAHACAVGGSGRMYCWGSQEFGRLGDGMDSIHRLPSPVDVSGLDQ